MTRMHVHIERLVLDGLALDARGAEALRASLEGALLDLAAGGGADPDRRSNGKGTTGGPGSVAPSALGRTAAHAIHRHVAG